MLSVSVSTNGTRIPVARERVSAIARAVLRAERVTDAMVSIAFVTSQAMAKLNRRFLGHRGPTNVIAFAFGSPTIGDIYICPDVARRNAHRFGVGMREELVRLVIHGVLHVVGHDHPNGEARTASPMWRRQERLVGRLRSA